MIDYVQPIMPMNWTGQERTFYSMLMRVLDDLHLREATKKVSFKSLVDKLKALDSAVAADPSDTEWEPLELINCVAWNADTAPKIRRKSSVVYIKGAVKRDVSTSNDTTVQIVTALPEVYRTLTFVNLPIITDAGLCRLLFENTGAVKMQNKTGGVLGQNRFISLDCSYAL